MRQKDKIALINGRVHTPLGIVKSLAFDGGRITHTAAPDTEEQPGEIVAGDARVIDLHGMTVLPGFCDSGMRLIRWAADSERSKTGDKRDIDTVHPDSYDLSSLLKAHAAKIAALGITEICTDDMASFGYDFRRMWDFFTAGAASGDLPFRVRLNLRFDDPDALNDFLSDGWRTGDGLPFCHVGAVACAAGLEPQRRVAEEAHMAGMQLCLGGSPEDALALIEQLMEKRDIGSRHVIDLGGAAEYVSMDESQIDRMKKIRACAAIAPSASQAGRTRDWASVVHGGIIISAGSGENGLTDPASIIGAVVAGDNSEERISVAEAIGLYTWNSAWNGRNERWRGELSPGCDADMVVLDRDPFGVTTPELSDIKVVMTVCGGCVTYDSGMLGATGAEEISE